MNANAVSHAAIRVMRHSSHLDVVGWPDAFSHLFVLRRMIKMGMENVADSLIPGF
eukprot:COSAG02_NODE_48165_length_335_cov_7.139831_1_plen_54_part_10